MPGSSRENRRKNRARRRAFTTRLDLVTPTEVDWLWRGRIPLGGITLLHGPPGISKSTLALDIAARVTSGQPMPAEVDGRDPAAVVLLSAEDSLRHTVRTRFDAAGGVAARVHVLESIPTRGGERLPIVPDDVPAIQQIVDATGALLVVIDVLDAFLMRSSSSMQAVRAALTPVKRMAEETGCAVLALGHQTKKAGKGPAMYRAVGSVGIVGAARSALVMGRDPQEPELVGLAHAKSNLAALAPTLHLRLVDAGSVARIEWLGEVDLSAEDLIAGDARDQQSAVNDAISWLGRVLANGRVPAQELEEMSKASGHSWTGAVRRAKETMGIEPKKVGDRWFWELPEDEQGEQGERNKRRAHLKLVPAPDDAGGNE